MIVPDVNLLLYAELDAFPQHAPARRWWEAVMNGERQVGIAPVVLFGFVRLATHRRVLSNPLPIADAIERARRWLERAHVVFLVPGARHLETAFRLPHSLGTGGEPDRRRSDRRARGGLRRRSLFKRRRVRPLRRRPLGEPAGRENLTER